MNWDTKERQDRWQIRLERWERQCRQGWETFFKHKPAEINTVMQECSNRDGTGQAGGWINDESARHLTANEVMYLLEKANLESFLDGHVRAFEYFGGVPRRIAYDNLKCAVIKVGKGKNHRLTKRFKELRAWYLFDTRFCNIAKGNEKGDVENCCKRSERTYLSPQPHVDGPGQLASKLFDDCQNDLKRKGPEVHGGKSVGELLEEERPYLLPSVLRLPETSDF